MTCETFLDGRVTLHRGDCLDILSTMPDGSVDCVLADPPYEKHMHVAKADASCIRIDGYASPQSVDFDSIEPIREDVAKNMVRISRGWCLVFCTPEGIAPWRDAFEAVGGRYKRACFWIKPDSAPQFNGQGPAMAVEAFVAVWCGKGHAKWNGGGKRNYWTYGTNAPFRDGRHPTEKPVDLLSHLITDFTQPDALICDPFMGSGTTGVACNLTKRRFVGIELQEKYYQIVAERIAGIRFGDHADAGPLFRSVA